ncbi:Na/Pi symporter [Candidatus Margulisiibacteriota bacterium]
MKIRNLVVTIIKIALILVLLYFFLSAINMLSTAFKLLGKEFANNLITLTSNPFIGLLIGIISTALIQSSSVTTAITVGLVSAGSLTVGGAVGIVMGANIGTTITSIMVSMGHIANKHEFKRAFAGSLMHDFYNIITVLILFPLEMMTHILERTATYCAKFFYRANIDLSYESPIKAASKILGKFFKSLFIKSFQMPEKIAGILIVILAMKLAI